MQVIHLCPLPADAAHPEPGEQLSVQPQPAESHRQPYKLRSVPQHILLPTKVVTSPQQQHSGFFDQPFNWFFMEPLYNSCRVTTVEYLDINATFISH